MSALAIAALLALSTAQAMATGFGRMNNASFLGQRLDVTLPVRLDEGESLASGCLSAEVQAGEFRLSANVVKVAIEPGAEPNERLIRIATNTSIDEPVVTVTLQAGCTNPVTRKFVTFVDPPVINLARAASSRPPAAESAPGAAQPTARAEDVVAAPAAAPPTDTREAAAPAPPKRKLSAKTPGRAAASATASRTAKASASARGTRKTSSTRVAAIAPTAKGARLSLDAPTPEVLLAQTVLRLSDSLPAVFPPAAFAPPEGASALAGASADADAQRVKLAALEASFDKLRGESQATQASLLLLQAQLRDSQSARYSNPLVYALIALVVLLGAALVFLLKQRAVARHAVPQWWAPPTGAASIGASAAVSPEARPTSGPVAVRPELWDAAEVDEGETTASPRLLAPAEVLPPAAAPLVAEREMSVEELIDLEQQAEFFVVLGQDEAAIDLLMGHVRSSGGTSPLPYLKLLEIYRRLDDREAYERTREKFNRRFNAYAPDWDVDLQMGRALEDYPHVIAKLQSLWNAPAPTMQTLEMSLFRRDPGASNFDLPAYRELLFLYSVARDLSEHGAEPAVSAKVDVLLPIDGETSATGTLTRLHPTRPMPIMPDAYTAPVDVDITTLDAGPPGDDGRPSRLQSDFNTTPGYIGLAIEKAAESR